MHQVIWSPGDPEIVEGRLLNQGGWLTHANARAYNLYRPPTIAPGDPAQAGPWVDHVHRLYPDHADHIIRWLAHRVQRPAEKINHALLLGGLQGCGKDTLLKPVREAIGAWNLADASPTQAMGRFNGFLKSVILLVPELCDLGDVNRYGFYEHMKPIIAAPPLTLRCDEKFMTEIAVLNVTGVIFTSNQRSASTSPRGIAATSRPGPNSIRLTCPRATSSAASLARRRARRRACGRLAACRRPERVRPQRATAEKRMVLEHRGRWPGAGRVGIVHASGWMGDPGQGDYRTRGRGRRRSRWINSSPPRSADRMDEPVQTGSRHDFASWLEDRKNRRPDSASHGVRGLCAGPQRGRQRRLLEGRRRPDGGLREGGIEPQRSTHRRRSLDRGRAMMLAKSLKSLKSLIRYPLYPRARTLCGGPSGLIERGKKRGIEDQ